MTDRDRLLLARRRFLQLVALGGGGVLAGCSSGGRPGAASSSSSSSNSSPTTVPPTVSTTVAPSTSSLVAPSARTLVLVQMNGGNDGLNTLVPDDGRYRDARPTLALPEPDVVRVSGLDGFGLHPALAPLTGLWDAGRLGLVEAVGFPDPDRSHFVAMDSWWTANDPVSPDGWLGRALAAIDGDLDPLYAVSLGSGAPVLRGSQHRPVEIIRSADFRFAPAVDLDGFRALGEVDAGDDLWMAAAASYGDVADAVERFVSMTTEVGDEDDLAPAREGGATLAAGLDTAASLIVAGGPSRLIVVSGGGFDTHAGQLATQAELLGDLARGIDDFFVRLDAAGVNDDVMLVAVSEFGRRVAENASGGTDHGKGGVAFVVGSGVAGGLHGSLDLGDLDEGDVRSVIDPRTVFTACLDWIGADPERVLGRRYDEVALLA